MTLKPARNAHCPCGSGKKYKRCCLPESARAIPVPKSDEEVRNDELLNGGRPERIRAMSEAVQSISRRSARPRQTNPSIDIRGAAKEDAKHIEVIFAEIEKFTSEALRSCPHSRQYWFQLLRRVAPLLWGELQSISESKGGQDRFAEVTKGAGLLVLACSIDGDPWEWVEEGGVRGIDFRSLTQKELLVAAQIFSLAQLRLEAQVRFRFACKGFRVFAQAGEEPDILAGQDTKSVICYEQRRSLYETLAGSAGLWCDPEKIVAIRRDLCQWFGLQAASQDYFELRFTEPAIVLRLQYSFRHLLEEVPPRKRATADVPSSSSITQVPYDRLIEHSELRQAFSTALGVDPPSLVAFLYSVFAAVNATLRLGALQIEDEKTSKVVWTDEPDVVRRSVIDRWREVGTVGLLKASKTDWIEHLHAISGQIRDFDGSVLELEKNQIEELVDRVTWIEGMPVNGNAPLLFTKVSSRTLLLDGFRAGDFLRQLLLTANTVSKDLESTMFGQDVTGAWLEKQAATYFMRVLALPLSNVIRGRRIGNAREIDIAFVSHGALFVIDCKAMAKDATYMEGQHQRIRNRQTEMRKELNEKNVERIELIRQGFASDVISQDSFDRAYGLVCTSAVEYLPIEDGTFWLEGVPLVGPPEELLDTIRVLSRQQR